MSWMPYAFRSLIALFALALGGAAARANDIYIAQTAQGQNTGLDCADAFVYTFFNTAGNWGTRGNQIGPGTTVHLCGTFTSQLTTQGSGASGSPVTVLFEPNSRISLPACDATNGCFSMANQSYITLDGGTNGIIEDTANGSGMSHSVDSIGVVITSCSNCTVQNLTIQNLYVHSSPSDTHTFNADGAIYTAAWTAGSNVTIQNNTIHDCHWCIWLNYGEGGNISNISIRNNTIYNADHGVAMAGYSTGSTQALTGLSLSGNSLHDFANWDTTAGVYHHDGIHLYANNGASATGAQIYNNTCFGSLGANITSCFYSEGKNPNLLIFNNLMYNFTAPSGNFGLIGFGDGATEGGGVYNNTMLGLLNSAFYCLLISLPDGSGLPRVSFENNVMSGCWAAVAFYVPSPGVGTFDFNAYAGTGAAGDMLQTSTAYTFANWQSTTGKDSNSRNTTNINLSPTGSPLAGSEVIGTGANLASLGINNLNSDKNGVPRAPAGPWTVGAFEFVATQRPTPPTSLTVIPH